jgi:choline dehydrogenase-like flavoprotein
MLYSDPNLIYDYIIVGTGPAGAVMAKTLSDNLTNSVLLLEAGDNNTNEVPIQDPTVQTWRYFSRYFWQGRTVPQVHLNRRLFNWTTGRILGGGSSVNGLQYARPSQAVLKKWEAENGPLWSAEQATLHYAQLENYYGMTEHTDAHGYQGRLHIQQVPEIIPTMTEKLVAAIEQATGIQVILDYNDPNTPIGPFHRWQLYLQPDGTRESSATAFLSSDIVTPEGNGVNGRQLRVLTRSTVLRIIINENREAIGVEYLQEGYIQYAYARKRVIISAGINSSQLLMLSGIGPADILQNYGIPVVFDNPNVGNNLVNQIIYSASITINPADLNELKEHYNILYYGGAFLPFPNSTTGDRGVQLIGQLAGDHLELLFIDLLPESRGTITLQNNDPLKIVLADYNFLSDPKDIEVIKTIFRTYILEIANQLSAIDPAYQLISPTPDIILDDALLENYIHNNVDISYHEQSFNRMAPFEQGGVVDSYGQVYGVNRLIVADTSIIPYTIDSNNSATSFLIGYTLALQILEEEALPSFNPINPPY